MPEHEVVHGTFWNLTDGVRPAEPERGFFAGICADMGHVYDQVYGPWECARCGEEVPIPGGWRLEEQKPGLPTRMWRWLRRK